MTDLGAAPSAASELTDQHSGDKREQVRERWRAREIEAPRSSPHSFSGHYDENHHNVRSRLDSSSSGSESCDTTASESSDTTVSKSSGRVALPMATQRMLAKPIWSNKFIKEGPRSPFSISEPDNMDSVCVRIDMPGADRKSLKIKIKDDRISFRASEDPASMHGGFDFTLERARTYVGSVIFDPSCYNAEDYNYVLVHGALWLYIRRYNSSVRSLNHVLLEKGNDTSPASGAAYNPLVSIGRDRYYTHVFTEDAFIMGVDMPGLRGEAAIMMAVQGLHLIIFRGEERVSLEDNYENEERRVYDGALKVDKHLYDAREFKSEFLNGVLWIEVPRRMKRDAGSEEPESTVMLYGLGRFGVDFGINTVRRG